MQKAEVKCLGRCDSFGDLNPKGSFVRVVYTTDKERHGIVMSEGAAELLAAELTGALAQKDEAAVADIMCNVRGA